MDLSSLSSRIHWWGVDIQGPFDGMLLDFIEKQVRRLAERIANQDRIEDTSKTSTAFRDNLIHSLGLTRLPHNSNLNAQLVGKIGRNGYSIEKIIFDTLPGFQVPAYLYLPDRVNFPVPSVLCVPGHWMENSKLEPDLQQFCSNLALQGFAVLIYDPIGQGERLGDWRDHGHLEPLLIGVSQEGLMVYESLRALDYLFSRPEVDKTRVGMVGASGGGLNTFYTSAIDKRINTCVIVCFVTTFFQMMAAERDLNWEDGVCLCNQVPRVMAYAEMSSVLRLISPRPLCLANATRDRMFPIEGARRVYQIVREKYSQAGFPDNIRFVELDAEHGFDRQMRLAAMEWFACHLKKGRYSDPLDEADVDLLPVPYVPVFTYIVPPERSDLPLLRRGFLKEHAEGQGYCFPVLQYPSTGPAITQLIRELAFDSPGSRRSLPDDSSGWGEWKSGLIDDIQQVLGPFPTPGPLNVRILKQNLHAGIFSERILFESEPGITVPSLFLAPAEWKKQLPAVIYVHEWGKRVGLENGDIQALLSAGFAVFAVDVRGVGETSASDFEAATNALMTDRPLFAQRVWDVIRSLDCLWNRVFIGIQIDKGKIGCFGRGMGGLLSIYATALDERFAACVACQIPLSYQDLIIEEPTWPASTYLFDVLNHFDLPDLMALVAPRPLHVSMPDEQSGSLFSSHHKYEDVLLNALKAYEFTGAAPGSFVYPSKDNQIEDRSGLANWIQKQLAL